VIVAHSRNFFATLCEIPTGYCPSVKPSVKVAQSCNFFATLCEIPTGYCPSVNPSVTVAQSRKFFSTLCEIPTGYIPSVFPLVKHKIFLIFFYVTLSQNLELQSYSTHNTITRADY
jgi:hypothetical protein